MEYRYYEQKINDIIAKCPIEAGVEILAYNLLDEIVNKKNATIVDINRLQKNQDKRITTTGGISDIAVLTNDFVFATETGAVLGLVEIKATNKSLTETEQIMGHINGTRHFIFTNGLIWRYYENHKFMWERKIDSLKRNVILTVKNVKVDESEFLELVEDLKKIEWHK